MNNDSTQQLSPHGNTGKDEHSSLLAAASDFARSVLESIQALAGTTTCKGVQIARLKKMSHRNAIVMNGGSKRMELQSLPDETQGCSRQKTKVFQIEHQGVPRKLSRPFGSNIKAFGYKRQGLCVQTSRQCGSNVKTILCYCP